MNENTSFIMKKYILPIIIFLIAMTPRLTAVYHLPYYNSIGGMGESYLSPALALINKGVLAFAYPNNEIRNAVENKLPFDQVRESVPPVDSSSRTPGYPFFLASILVATGNMDVLPIQLIQIILDSVAAVLIFIIISSVSSRKLGFVGGLIYAFWPPFIQYSFTIHGGALSMFINTVILTIVVRSYLASNLNNLKIIVLSVLTVLSIMLRPDSVWLGAYLSLMILMIVKRPVLRKIGSVALFVMLVAILMIPWMTRNYYHYGKVIPLTPYGPHGMWIGLGDFPELVRDYAHITSDGDVIPMALKFGYDGPIDGSWNNKEKSIKLNAFLKKLFKEEILNKRVGQYIAHVSIKTLRFFFAHRHITVGGNYLKIPVGGSRSIGIGSFFDLLLIPGIFVLLVVFYYRSRFFWMIYLFYFISTAVHSMGPMNELRYMASSAITFPILFVLFIIALQLLYKTRNLKKTWAVLGKFPSGSQT